MPAPHDPDAATQTLEQTGAPSWQPNALLGQGYRVERLLGEGGMGVVVAARQVETGELVAIKLIRSDRAGDRAFLKRFLREARIAFQLKSEHVVRVLQLGELASGVPYLVMEYLDGGTIESLLRETGPLPVETAVDFLLQVCEAVAEAHALGVVHRDLKPANLFVARRPDGSTSIKVIDFGISKWTGSQAPATDESHLTTTATLIGSPRYMSPEQLSTPRSVDSRADIWALGVILYEIVTGGHPFASDSVASTYARILRDPMPSMRALAPAVPPGLDAVCRQCCDKDSASRMPSVIDLAVALAPYGSAGARASVERIVATTPRAGTTVVRGELVSAPPRRRRVALLATLVGVACAVGVFEVGRMKLGKSGRAKTVDAPVETTVVTPVETTAETTAETVERTAKANQPAGVANPTREPPRADPGPSRVATAPSLPPSAPPPDEHGVARAPAAADATAPRVRSHGHRNAARTGVADSSADKPARAQADPHGAPAAAPPPASRDEDLFTTRR